MADYRDHYPEIQLAGASVVAISVDAPEKSQALRADLSLPFPILCDTEHRAVRDWAIYNAAEKGGIAKPAVFIVNCSQVVSYAAVDTTVKRVPAAEIVQLLSNAGAVKPIRCRVRVPSLSDWLSAIRNYFHN